MSLVFIKGQCLRYSTFDVAKVNATVDLRSLRYSWPKWQLMFDIYFSAAALCGESASYI